LSTFDSDEPAAFRQCLSCVITRSAWLSKATRSIAPVCGSNGGRPDTNTNPFAMLTGKDLALR
jgi:hypothetical protein